MINKKYITRRVLDTYSEEVFAKKLIKKEQEPFFPFKDKGIDIISIDKENNSFFYQLKARNKDVKYGEYWLMVNIKKLEKFPKTKRSFWVFCCFKEEGVFDFFVIPLNITKKWFYLYNASEGIKNKHEEYFLKIRPLPNERYEISPRWLNKNINIMKYLLK